MWKAITERERGLVSSWKSERRLLRVATRAFEPSNYKEIVSVHKSGVNSLQIDFSEGRYLLAGASDGSLAAYDTQLPSSLDEGGSHGDGMDEHTAVFSVTKTTEGAHRFCVSSVHWYPVDNGLFVSGSFDKTVKVWDTNTLQVELQFSMPGKVYAVAMSALMGTHSLVAAASSDPRVRLCDVASGGFTHTLVGHRDAVWALQWSASSEWVLISGACDGAIRFWDIRRAGCFMVLDQHATQLGLRPRVQKAPSGEAVRGRGGPNQLIAPERRGSAPDRTGREPGRQSVAVSGLGGGVAAGNPWAKQPMMTGGSSSRGSSGQKALLAEDKTTRLHPGLASVTSKVTAHDGGVSSLLPTSDGFFLLSSGTDSRLRLWDVASGRNALVNYGGIRNNKAQKGLQIAVSPDASLVYHPSGTTLLGFELTTGRLVSVLRGHYDTVNCCTFNPNQMEMYSGGNDRQILVWTAPRLPDPEPGQNMEGREQRWSLPDEDAWSE